MANKHTLVLALGLALVIGASVSVTAPADDNDAFTDIKKQADQVGKKSWDDLTKDGKAIAKKHEDPLDIMYAFKPRKSKTPGIGIGPTPEAILPDGIELKINKLASNKEPPMSPAALEKEQKDLIRMAEIVAAVASISVHHCPVDKKTKDRDPKDWAKWMKGMHDGSADLIKALKDRKPIDVKNAADKLNTTCIECHQVFRDKVP